MAHHWCLLQLPSILQKYCHLLRGHHGYYGDRRIHQRVGAVVEPVSNYNIHHRQDSFNSIGKCLAQRVWLFATPKLLIICLCPHHSRNAGQPMSAASTPTDTPCDDSNCMFGPVHWVVRLVATIWNERSALFHSCILSASSVKAMQPVGTLIMTIILGSSSNNDGCSSLTENPFFLSRNTKITCGFCNGSVFFFFFLSNLRLDYILSYCT